MVILAHLGSVLAALGMKSIPVVEMSLNTVNRPRLPNNPIWSNHVTTEPDLQFRGVELVHAVVKADFLNRVNPLMPGLGFILHSHHVINWQSSSIRLRQNATSTLSDFVQTGLAGRVGQGLAILLVHSEGYAFQVHLRSFLTSKGIPVTNAQKQPLAIADFVFESGAGVRCLVEAKGSFRQLKNCPKVTKAEFKNALNKQVLPWMTQIQPPATKSYVVASYIREAGAANTDPSVVAFVDPEESAGAGDVVLTSEELRRENYAAWLSAMGLGASAQRLLRNSSDGPSSHSFIVLELGGLEIAFHSPCIESWCFWPHTRLTSSRDSILSFGIEVETLRAISEAIRGRGKDLAEIEPLPYDSVWRKSDDSSYSIFPDKTFFGSLEGCRVKTRIEVEL